MSVFDPALALFANDSFYRAFNARDMNGMNELWAETLPVYCLHPGWPALFGRAEVLESWQRILGNPNAPRILSYGAKVLHFGDTATVICYEQLPGGVCVASNGFVLEYERPRMVWHQSGTCEAPPSNEDRSPTWQ